MSKNNFNSIINNLTSYIESFRPIIYIKNFDYGLVDEYIIAAAEKAKKKYSNVKVYEYFGAYRDFGTKKSIHKSWGNDLYSFLKHYNEPLPQDRDSQSISILLLKDINNDLDNPIIVSYLKYIALRTKRLENEYNDCVIIIISSFLNIPRELEKMITFIDIPVPDSNEIKVIIEKWDKKNEIIEENFKNSLVDLLKGFSRYEILQILELFYVDKGRITKEDRAEIINEKKQLIKKSNLLEFIDTNFGTDNINEVIGGLDNLKRWLKNIKFIFEDIERAKKSKVTIPKGILLLGIPGCGKSLVSKFISAMLKVPLLKLDIGNLLGKYLGESEENLKSAISYAEAVSPCVLWLDEIEKAFSGAGNNESHEVTNRLFGSFLTWLQECQYPVFTVATSNNISNLPPEFLRKGRFNEIFFVDLPDEKEREKIFEIKIKEKDKDLINNLDIEKLSKDSDKYTGADIEAVVNEVFIKDFIRSKVNNKENSDVNRISISNNDFKSVMGKVKAYGKIFEDQIKETKDYIEKKKITYANDDSKYNNRTIIEDYEYNTIKELENNKGKE